MADQNIDAQEATGEFDVDYEVHQDGIMVASSTCHKDAEHYAAVYAQDGPVELKTCIRIPGFHVIEAQRIAELHLSSGGQSVTADPLPAELQGVADVLSKNGGAWRSCTGCHELSEGRETGLYSTALQCHLGNGCEECGGIGAIWDATEYQAVAIAIAPAHSKSQPQAGYSDIVSDGGMDPRNEADAAAGGRLLGR